VETIWLKSVRFQRTSVLKVGASVCMMVMRWICASVYRLWSVTASPSLLSPPATTAPTSLMIALAPMGAIKQSPMAVGLRAGIPLPLSVVLMRAAIALTEFGQERHISLVRTPVARKTPVVDGSAQRQSLEAKVSSLASSAAETKRDPPRAVLRNLCLNVEALGISSRRINFRRG